MMIDANELITLIRINLIKGSTPQDLLEEGFERKHIEIALEENRRFLRKNWEGFE